MNVLLIVLGGAAAALVALYLVARKFEPVGSSIGFLCAFLANVFVSIKEYMEKSAVFCKNACTASLRFPPGITDGDYWQGVIVLSRNVFFVVASCVLGGETFGTLEVVPSLFQSANHFAIPGITELSLAAVIVSTPALWGSLTLECLGVIHGCGLFPRLDTLQRWVLGVLSLLMTVAAILLYGYFYVYRRELLTDPQSAQDMTLYLFSGLGILTASSAVLALYAFVVGGAGVVSLLLLIAEVVCNIIAALVSLPINLLNVVSIHVSGMDVTQKYSDPVRVDLPPVKFLPSGQTPVALLPQHAASKVAQTDEIVPIEQTEMEKFTMSNPEKSSSFVFLGAFGSQLHSHLSKKVEALKAGDTILTSACLDLTNPRQLAALRGTLDLSPSVIERKIAMSHGETEGEAYTKLLSLVDDRVVSAHLPTLPAPLVFVIDCRLLVYAVEMLENVRRRLPLHPLVVVTSLSASDAQDILVHTGMVDMDSLAEEGIIDNVTIIDPRSQFAVTYGEAIQRDFLAQKQVSLLLAQKHSASNPSYTSVLRTLSPFTTFSFASKPVALGNVAKQFKLLPGASRSAGAYTGDYSDILAQSREVVKQVLTDEDTRAFGAEVDLNTPCALVLNTPIPLVDPRYNEYCRDMSLWIGTNYPNVTHVMSVRGNGIALPYHLGGRFLISAACLYPVSLPRMKPAQTVKVTPLYPASPALEPVGNNGHVSTLEQKKESNATRAIVPAKKKAAPARRTKKQAGK